MRVPVVPVADVTGSPEILDGRVKTLHPKVAGGVLAIRSNDEHMASLAEHHLCEPRGILYLHVLQPTLHDPGSKPITPEEQEKGIGDDLLKPAVVFLHREKVGS